MGALPESLQKKKAAKTTPFRITGVFWVVEFSAICRLGTF